MDATLTAILEAHAFASDYGRGVGDLLCLLGLLDRDGSPVDEVAAMVIASLAAHARDGVSAGLPWGQLDGDGLRGVDILRALEKGRVERVADPTPARTVYAVQAVVKGRRDEQDVYLMQFDRHGGHFQLPGGKVDPGDASPEAALRREIGEELGLDRTPAPAECALAPLRSGWGFSRLSPTYGIYTRYTFDFYHVERLGISIPLDQDTRWLARAEVVAGSASDGRPVSDVLVSGLGLPVLDGLPLTLIE